MNEPVNRNLSSFPLLTIIYTYVGARCKLILGWRRWVPLLTVHGNGASLSEVLSVPVSMPEQTRTSRNYIVADIHDQTIDHVGKAPTNRTANKITKMHARSHKDKHTKSYDACTLQFCPTGKFLRIESAILGGTIGSNPR